MYNFQKKYEFAVRVSNRYLVEEIKKVDEVFGPISGEPKTVKRCYYFIPSYKQEGTKGSL